MMRLAGTPDRSDEVQLSPGRDVDAESLFEGDAGHGATEERLGRERHAVVEGCRRLATPRAKGLFVVDEERRAVDTSETTQ